MNDNKDIDLVIFDKDRVIGRYPKNTCIKPHVIDKYNKYAIEFASRLLQKSNNASCSPLSMFYGLIPLAYGLEETEVHNFSKLFNIEQEDFKSFYQNSLDSILFNRDTSNSCSCVNLLVGNSRVSKGFKTSYINDIKSFYRGYLGLVDLNKQDSKDYLSNFVYENTEHKFKPGFNDLDPLTSLVNINTINLNDQWLDGLLKVEKKTFNNKDNHKAEMDFIHESKCHSYFKSDNEQFLTLGLGSGFKFNIYMNNKSTYDDVEKLHNYLGNNTNLKDIKDAEVSYYIPMFESHNVYENIRNLLIEWGFREILCPINGYTEIFGGNKFENNISYISHGSDFKLNEKGISATAYSVITMARCCLRPDNIKPIELIFDHPFVYSITNNEGLIIFVGKVDNIES